MNSPSKNNSFFERVYEVVRMVPFGRVSSYGAIARYLGTAQSSRMVGWALNNCHNLNEYVPAHRIVNRNGLLTGKTHFGSQNAMQELLEAEGIQIENNQVVNFNVLFWDPKFMIE